MFDLAELQSDRHTASPGFNLREKYQRVISRSKRLKCLLGMRASDIVVRNERRMLNAAVKDLLQDDEVGEIISFAGTAIFIVSLNYIAGAEIEKPAMQRLDIPAKSKFRIWPQVLGDVT